MSEAAGVFDVVMVLGLLAVAAVALFHPRRLTAAAMFLVFGVLLAVVWAWLGAPDVAIAEAVLGAGVTGVLVMNAVTGNPMTAEETDRGRGRVTVRGYMLVAGFLAAAVAVGLIGVLWDLAPATGTGTLVERNVADSGVSHPVTAVLLNFRNYDTLLEIAVLAAAAVGALALRPPGTRMPQLRHDSGPLGAMVRLVVPVLALVLGWLLVAGSTRPGGAFQAGALLAGALLMLFLAGIGPTRRLQRWTGPVLLLGLAVFLALAAGTAAIGGGWLVLDADWAGPVIVALEAVLMISIGTTLAVLLMTMDQINSAARDIPGVAAWHSAERSGAGAALQDGEDDAR